MKREEVKIREREKQTWINRWEQKNAKMLLFPDSEELVQIKTETLAVLVHPCLWTLFSSQIKFSLPSNEAVSWTDCELYFSISSQRALLKGGTCGDLCEISRHKNHYLITDNRTVCPSCALWISFSFLIFFTLKDIWWSVSGSRCSKTNVHHKTFTVASV